ncbi:MAG TPA: hypothetical protein DD733_00415, partial [Clostridiales bacterium]|nr:hypothetical protein [Clostridiales bacterium]
MITSEYRLHSGASGYDYEAIRLYNSSVPPQNRFLRKHCHTCIELSLFKSGRGFYNYTGGKAAKAVEKRDQNLI